MKFVSIFALALAIASSAAAQCGFKGAPPQGFPSIISGKFKTLAISPSNEVTFEGYSKVASGEPYTLSLIQASGLTVVAFYHTNALGCLRLDGPYNARELVLTDSSRKVWVTVKSGTGLEVAETDVRQPRGKMRE